MREAAKIATAKHLRRNLTKPELWLWLRLRAHRSEGLNFRSQHPIGPYILDFYCARARLCVEVDGEVHTRALQRKHDTIRDAWLIEQGIHVYRINAVDLLADPDEAASSVIALAQERLTR